MKGAIHTSPKLFSEGLFLGLQGCCLSWLELAEPLSLTSHQTQWFLPCFCPGTTSSPSYKKPGVWLMGIYSLASQGHQRTLVTLTITPYLLPWDTDALWKIAAQNQGQCFKVLGVLSWGFEAGCGGIWIQWLWKARGLVGVFLFLETLFLEQF